MSKFSPNSFYFWFSILFYFFKLWIYLLHLQIAGDMLCADQNFDIAQVIRFFRSKVREAWPIDCVVTGLF